MPGIAGILEKRPLEDGPKRIDTMLQAMMHQTGHAKASHVDQKIGWYGGGVAIISSFADCMPVYNETRDVVAFLAGECFVDSQTTSWLRGKGHAFKPDDASCLVHLYEEDGPRFVEKLNGWFSGLVFDRRQGNALLFNDRYGMQRIYYYEDECAFYFASEAKALLRAKPALKAMELQSLVEYLCFDCVLNDRSYFPDVCLLPPGSSWVYEGGIIERSSYFDPAQLENQPPLGSQQFLEELAGTFETVLPRYLTGEKVSVAVTGGLDTRLIMACLRPDRDHIQAFTFGGMYRDSMDVRIGRAVSNSCNITHRTIKLDTEFLSDYASHAAQAVYITDGLADATTLDSVYLDQQARDLAPVKLTGVFGSQVLGRVRRALRDRCPDLSMISDEIRDHLAAGSRALLPFEQEHDLSYVLKREVPWYWSRFTVPQMSQLTLRSPFLDNDLVNLLYRAPHEGFNGSSFEMYAIARNKPRLLEIRTNLGLAGNAPPLISKAIRMTIRTRGLADKVLNWDTLPHSLQHMVAKVDARVLSPLYLDRLFRGFGYFRHYNLWFRQELAPYLREMLLDDRTLSRPYWNAKHLARIVNDHIEGRGRYLSEIRKVLTIELIHRTLVEDRE